MDEDLATWIAAVDEWMRDMQTWAQDLMNSAVSLPVLAPLPEPPARPASLKAQEIESLL